MSDIKPTRADQLMGMATPGDEKASVLVRHWEGMKRALWRSRVAWEIAQREATNLLAGVSHMEGCPGKTDETASCLPDCPDREVRMSALVILNAARQFAPLDARRQDGPYYAPSREHFSEVIAELGACQAELESLRGSTVTTPMATVASPPQLKEEPK
jgi:hypothetical protein